MSAAGPALAEEPASRIFLEHLTAARLNPLGLQDHATVSYRLRLYDTDSDVLAGNYLMIGPTMSVSPAFVKPGIRVKLKPTALTEFTAAYQHEAFFGTFDAITFFDNTQADWSDTNIDIIAPAGAAQPGGGPMLSLTGRFQIALGPIAARYTMLARQHNIKNPGGAYMWDASPDMLVPAQGWYSQHDTDAIYLAGSAKLGMRWTYVAPYFGNGAKSEGNDSHKVGPLIAYSLPAGRTGSAFAHPTAIVLSQWHLKHRFRTGVDVPQAIPYFALVFLFEGDLMPFDLD